MSFELWQKLPRKFLRMKSPSFYRLDHDVKQLIVDLAQEQNFKCALCSWDRNLVIEHDHEYRRRVPYTIYNIRGLVCHRCNRDLMIYEITESGELLNWDNISYNLSSHEYEDYIYAYECRVIALHETLLEKRVPNYGHRRLILDRFDDWYYEGGQPPLWYRRYKEKKSIRIETPEEFVRGLTAILQFVNEQFKKDPNFEPPEEFWKLMARIRPIIDEALKERAPPANASVLPLAG